MQAQSTGEIFLLCLPYHTESFYRYPRLSIEVGCLKIVRVASKTLTVIAVNSIADKLVHIFDKQQSLRIVKAMHVF